MVANDSQKCSKQSEEKALVSACSNDLRNVPLTVLLLLGFGAGGDIHAFHSLSRLSARGRVRVKAISSTLAFERARSIGLNTFQWYVVSPAKGTTIPSYLIHTFKVTFTLLTNLKLSRESDLLYIPTHFFEFVVDGLIAKIINPRIRTVIWFHHLIPNPSARREYRSQSAIDTLTSALSYLSQRFGILIAKKYGDACIVLNNLSLERMSHVLPSTKLYVVGNGVETRSFGQMQGVKTMYDGCMIGISPSKGSIDAVLAWASVVKASPNAKLVCMGHAGPWMPILTKLVRRLNLTDNVFFTGFVSEPEKESILEGSKLFLAPMYEEGWSIATSEALSHGMPVIAYEDETFLETYGDSIMYVPRGDINSLSDMIMKVLVNDRLSQSYARLAIQWAKRRSWDDVSEVEGKVLEKVAQSFSHDSLVTRHKQY